MPSDFTPVRSILARERERGRPFAEAWEMALEDVEDRYDRQVLRDTRQGRSSLARVRSSTRSASRNASKSGRGTSKWTRRARWRSIRSALLQVTSTGPAWQDGYERRESTLKALA